MLRDLLQYASLALHISRNVCLNQGMCRSLYGCHGSALVGIQLDSAVPRASR